jgi:guanylate kinase
MHLETLINEYSLPSTAAELIRSTKIVLLTGISGAGKDTLKKELLKRQEFRDIISHTTRSPRQNNGVLEVDDIDYHFIDEATAQRMLEAREFIEAKFVHGTVYGTSIAALQQIHDDRKTAVTDLDVQGVAEYKKVSLDVNALFILPPDYDSWIERLRTRYPEDMIPAVEWTKRRESAIRELTHALLVPYYHFIINDKLDQTVAAAIEIISHPTDEFHSKDDEARMSARALLQTIRNHD